MRDGTSGLRLGLADHYGWAVAVTASAEHDVVDRRRLELIEPGLPAAPIHHVGGPHLLHQSGPPVDDDALAALVVEVRASVGRAASAALDALVAGLPAPITSLSIRDWPADFPQDVAVQRRAPYESRADPIMYRQVLAELAQARRWQVHRYGKDVEKHAVRVLGDAAEEVLQRPRATLGPPWSKDHRMAFAATIMAGVDASAGR
jgi:hypothetical protein